MKLDFIYKFIANVQNTFLGTNNSLNYRAKLIASMVAVLKDNKPELDNIIRDISNEIYKKKLQREIFLVTIKDYILIARSDCLGVDKLLKDILKLTKQNPKYINKINFVQLDKLILRKHSKENEIEIENYAQIRVLEFLKNEVIK
ncbi:hypothetical protein [Campylobacter sp. MG1]|uniref:hypothetical protein n=1 Tax=Campylobacter sp. MG1 TaxID=2976332 RepID=UPI00226CDD57|nr:hypothetical protein [Campylobacter sp. MG1]